jgi:hypothetical protein
VVLVIVATGCAPALPTLSGGRTTPGDRADLAVGLAARAPALDLSPPDAPGTSELLTLSGPGGIVPVGVFRMGLDEDWDLGVVVAGTGGRIEVRSGGALGTLANYHVGAAVSAGYQTSEARQGTTGEMLASAEGYRAGGFVPLGIGAAIGGIFEAWGTVRLGAEYVAGSVGSAMTARSGDAWILRSGLALGLGVGFRRIHVLLELSVDFEHVRGQLGGVAIDRSGIVLTPATALRLRF